MKRICRDCGSEELELVTTFTRKGVGIEYLVYWYHCIRCGYFSEYGEFEPTKFSRKVIKRAIALDNTV